MARGFRPLAAVNLVCGALLLCLPWTVRGGDWPQWGGPDPGRNLFSDEVGLPDSFDVGEFNVHRPQFDMGATRNVRWIAELGSQSYGNVVIAQGRVFVGTNNDSPRDAKHQGDRSILLVLDENTGAFLWQLVIPKLASGKVNDWENLGLLSSPTIEGDRVYVVTTRCEVLCLSTCGLGSGNRGPFIDEAQYIAGPGQPRIQTGPKDGDILWRYDMMDELNVFPHNGTRSQPVIVGDLLYVPTSNGMDWTHAHVPSPLAPSLIALNKHTGQLVAEDNAGIGPHILHSQWSSPSHGIVGGRPLIFYGGGNGYCYSFDARPVREREHFILPIVWSVNCNPSEYYYETKEQLVLPGSEIAQVQRTFTPIRYPAANGPSEIIGTPVLWRNRIYVATGQDPEHGEGVGNLVCIDARTSGQNASKSVLWRYRDLQRSMSTVSITPDGLLFIADFSGFVHCLDALTGTAYWKEDLRAHVWGSTLAADGKVYIGDEDGDFTIFAAAREKRILHEINLGVPIYSTPVAANGVLYVTSNSHLFALQNAVPATEPSSLSLPPPAP